MIAHPNPHFVPPYDGKPGDRRRSAEGGYDRRDLFGDTPHGLKLRGIDGCKRLIGRTKAGMNTKLHTYTAAAALLNTLPKAEWLVADRAMMLTGSERCPERQGHQTSYPEAKVPGKANQI